MQTLDLKKRQIEHHAFYKNEINKLQNHSCNQKNIIIDFIAQRPLNTALKILPETVKGKSILCVCSGRGDEAITLLKKGAIVTATDISQPVLDLIKYKEPKLKTELMDAENMPYEDNSFDYVLVKHGLHHLPRPILGLYEMTRVAKSGIIVIEAQDTWAMNILLKFNMAEKIEESGNFVYRFSRKEMKKIFNTMFIHDVQIKTEWYQYSAFLNKHVYPYLNNKIGFALFKYILKLFNLIFGHWGNNFIMVVKKNET